MNATEEASKQAEVDSPTDEREGEDVPTDEREGEDNAPIHEKDAAAAAATARMPGFRDG
jgi:hypothetical protein